MDITPSKQSQVVALRQHSGLFIRQIADRLGIAKSTLERIVNTANEDVTSASTIVEDVGEKGKLSLMMIR